MPISDRGAPHSPRRSLVVNAAELLRQPGASKQVAATLDRHELELDDARLHGDVEVDVELVSALDRVLAAGTFAVSFAAECSRCLTPVDRRFEVSARETFAHDPHDDELFAIEHGQLDLALFVREAILLALPDAPLCRHDCKGLCPTCGADRNVGACGCDAGPADDRWSVLDQLRPSDLEA